MQRRPFTLQAPVAAVEFIPIRSEPRHLRARWREVARQPTDRYHENSCAEGTLDCGSSSYRFTSSPLAHLPYEPRAESGSCCYRSPRRFAHFHPQWRAEGSWASVRLYAAIWRGKLAATFRLGSSFCPAAFPSCRIWSRGAVQKALPAHSCIGCWSGVYFGSRKSG